MTFAPRHYQERVLEGLKNSKTPYTGLVGAGLGTGKTAMSVWNALMLLGTLWGPDYPGCRPCPYRVRLALTLEDPRGYQHAHTVGEENQGRACSVGQFEKPCARRVLHHLGANAVPQQEKALGRTCEKSMSSRACLSHSTVSSLGW